MTLCTCSGVALDDVHVGEGCHVDNVLHGDNVVVLTRRGDKIKGRVHCQCSSWFVAWAADVTQDVPSTARYAAL